MVGEVGQRRNGGKHELCTPLLESTARTLLVDKKSETVVGSREHCLDEIIAEIGNHAAVHNLLALELDNLACRTQHDDIVRPRLDAGIGCEGLVALLLCDNLDWRDAVDVGESLVELLLRNVESLDIGLVVGLAPRNPQILDTLVLKEHVVVEVAGHLPYERT